MFHFLKGKNKEQAITIPQSQLKSWKAAAEKKTSQALITALQDCDWK